MLLPLPTPTEMSIWDHETINSIGIPGITLMETASHEAVNVILEEYGSVAASDVFCFVGSGNNGGDGLAIARHLHDLGANVTVFHTKPQKDYTGETGINLSWANKLDIPLTHLSDVSLDTLPQPDIIIDALLGTGFSGDLRPAYQTLIQTINRLGHQAFVLAVDIPSGLNGLSGSAQPIAVMADATATFEAPKLGLVMPEADQYTGTIHVCPIGIPLKIQNKHGVDHHLITREIMHLIPHVSPTMHKGKAGHVLILGGSAGLTGAPHLAGLGALRSGAGLVTIGCPGGVADAIKAGSPDIMTLPLGEGSTWKPSLAHLVLNELSRFDAVILGPGIGRDTETQAFIAAFIRECTQPIILDADALFALAQSMDLLDVLPEQTVLTPHPGEMARLLTTSSAKIQADRMQAVRTFSHLSDATLVLKGAGTVVSDSDLTCLSPFSEPNLAVGGSGDVLSGVIGSLMAQGLAPIQAACLGVYWHGLAGSALNEEFPMRGNLASEIAHMLPTVATTKHPGDQPC
ncbi:NAD(P)H-hydrate dehydratase [Pseudodesulfovibrio sp. JC047]|uniref:NAD(P)H-hydrate dehydratase n=1 Tax=Pseudodesulfovibrio sp. JC047 TaxID=2683199 RepID=UPI0013D64A7B|nr:NAD(P)H-hydrate dehydratase [Pseudodesulfovibrio sp. JC047]NDV20512.1 NAD(P)H-hydrate dehydratase [Pseudodesulfovibrio sp. JC047]